MPVIKRDNYTESDIAVAYDQGGSLEAMKVLLDVSYPTAQRWAQDTGIKVKSQGYNAPMLSITGLQCRHAREYLGLTRDTFCASANVSKTALRQFELGKASIRRETEQKIMQYFKGQGIAFKDGLFTINNPTETVKNKKLTELGVDSPYFVFRKHMSKTELATDPVVLMLLEDIKSYVAGERHLLTEAKRSAQILKHEYDITPSFLAKICNADLMEISNIW
ncbi:helix-turn-helix domain-containing protein [Enterovibrio calviensis]|uniref:helix-turn-helix domain-containing protein n=1 Tax=Enterovibrio calviensis TaxID=91359 RepID=UPI0037364E13